MCIRDSSLTVANGATVTVGGGSQVVVAGTLHVTGSMLAQSINNAGQVNGLWAGQGVKIVAQSVLVDAGASIYADGQGYPSQTGPGSSGSSNSPGGSYGGAGGGQAATTTYGSSTNPVDLGSGGGIDVLLSARRVGPTGKEMCIRDSRSRQRPSGPCRGKGPFPARPMTSAASGGDGGLKFGQSSTVE